KHSRPEARPAVAASSFDFLQSTVHRREGFPGPSYTPSGPVLISGSDSGTLKMPASRMRGGTTRALGPMALVSEQPVETPRSPRRERAPAAPLRRGWLVAFGVAVFHLSLLLPGTQTEIWLPAAGLAIALVAWTGLVAVAPLALDYLAVRLLSDMPV